jgi:hypothetical protein
MEPPRPLTSVRAGQLKHLRDLDFLGEDGGCRRSAKIIALNQRQKILTKNQKVEIQDHGCLLHLEIDAHLCSREGGEREGMSLQECLRQMYHLDLIFSEEIQMK